MKSIDAKPKKKWPVYKILLFSILYIYSISDCFSYYMQRVVDPSPPPITDNPPNAGQVPLINMNSELQLWEKKKTIYLPPMFEDNNQSTIPYGPSTGDPITGITPTVENNVMILLLSIIYIGYKIILNQRKKE